MRKGIVKYNQIIAGTIWEDQDGFHFLYDSEYIEKNNPQISVTLPLQELSFKSKTMFPFFDGLIPEGWLLSIAEKNWKLNTRDRMQLLLTCCEDCIGAVSVFKISENE